MKSIDFAKTSFVSSFAKIPLPLHLGRLPQFCLIGRSNVGKSSLINHLTMQKGLAKVSNTPGKTQLINLFLVDEQLLLVDLPGYGYSETGKEIKSQWQQLIEDYLLQYRPHLLLLLDSRHPPSSLDEQMIRWSKENLLTFDCILTKMDKLTTSERHRTIQRMIQFLSKPPLLYSIKDVDSRKKLLLHLKSL